MASTFYAVAVVAPLSRISMLGVLQLWLLMQCHDQKRQRQEEVNQTEWIPRVFAALDYCNTA